MNIFSYFERENKRLKSSSNEQLNQANITDKTLTNKTPNNTRIQLINYIKNMQNTLSIKKNDHDKLLWIIDKSFPITLWNIFTRIIERLSEVANCQKDTCEKDLEHDHEKQKVTLESLQTLCTMFKNVYGDKYSFNIPLTTCVPLVADKIIFEYDDIKFTKGQKLAINKMLSFLEDPKAYTFGLFGYAGTGKTTLITKFVKEIVSKRYITSINFSAPTNKAVNVIKTNFAGCIESLITLTTSNASQYDTQSKQIEYLKLQGIKINLTTIHKLLEYKNELTKNGEKVFVKSDKSSNKILTSYDLIIIDECSMLESQIIVDLFKTIEQLKGSLVKIIFIGDPAQLAPVREPTSCIFNSKRTEFNEIVLSKHFNLLDKSRYYIPNLIEDILSYDKVVLDEIVRSSNSSIKGLCNECRKWVLYQIKLPLLTQYKCDNIKIYRHKVDVKKTDSNWFKRYVNYVKRNDTPVNNIILTWRNAQTDEYNNTIRKMLFKKTSIAQYEPGDILMMNEFYILRSVTDQENRYIENEDEDENKKYDKKNKLYTCEQIKVIEATQIDYPLKRIVEPKYPVEYHKLIGAKVAKLVKDLNTRIPLEYRVWRLIVKKLADNTISKSGIEDLSEYDYLVNSRYAILTHKEEILERINSDKAYVKKQMELFGNFLETKFPDKKKLEMLTDKIVIELWKQINEILEDPFANVNICFSMTTHKSQSSTYYNVFVDVDDLLANTNDDDVRKCLYTAVTRTSHELHLLI